MTERATDREFDIVLYGATGFVGKLTAEYLAKAGGNCTGKSGRWSIGFSTTPRD